MSQQRGQTLARVVGAEVSARTKTEEKYTSGRLHKALEKGKIKLRGGKHKKTCF